MSTSNSKSYSELLTLPTFRERYDYLKLTGAVGDETFGAERYLNQVLYNSAEWKRARREVLMRDDGCDLADPTHPLFDKVIVHHINPITIEDVVNRAPSLFDPENLICVSHATHNAIHYGDATQLQDLPPERTPNDTCPWK